MTQKARLGGSNRLSLLNRSLGQTKKQRLRPQGGPLLATDSPQLRSDAEQALALVAGASAAGPLRHPEAADSLDLGVRGFDFIGQKF